MRRIAAIALFHLRIGVARDLMDREDEKSAPLAVVIGTQHERALSGGTRIDEVSPEAFALGIRPGITMAAARARAAHLLVRVVRPESVEAAVARLSESLLSFGATVSYALADGTSPVLPKRGLHQDDVVFVDVTGCAHLHACAEDSSGERVLAARLDAHVAEMRFAARVAIANGPRLAHAVARHMPISPSRRKEARLPIVILPGIEREAVAALPLSALPLDEDSHRYLRKLGLSVVGDLAELPQDALGSRLGALAQEVLALARGDDRAPLAAYVPPESPQECIELEDPVERTDALLFVAKSLADRMGARLEGRGVRASGLDLVFELERAFVPEGQSPRAELTHKLAAPIGSAIELLAIIRARLESYEVVAPIRAMVLRCHELAPIQGKPLSLFESEPKAERALPELAAELVTLLGRDNVGVLVMEDTWCLERRTSLVPFAETRSDPRVRRRAGLAWVGEEPLRLAKSEERFPLPRVAPLVQRQEAVEWWRDDGTSPASPERGQNKSAQSVRDFAVAWSEEAQAPAWIEIDRKTGRAWLRGWKE